MRHLLLLFVLLLLAIACDQQRTSRTGTEKVRAHDCTADCSGAWHALLHGEEGHVCSSACERIREGRG